jgi:large subunit ribosomal protein L23
MKEAHQIIVKLLLTEKGSRLTESENKYLFRVHKAANKLEIKRAIEDLFRVKVTKVNVHTRMGKMKRNRGQQYGQRPSWKRAVVTLKQGDKIDLT